MVKGEKVLATNSRCMLFLALIHWLRNHPCPVEPSILFLILCHSLIVPSKVNPPWTSPFARFKIQHIPNNLAREIPANEVMRLMSGVSHKGNLQWEFPTTFLAFL